MKNTDTKIIAFDTLKKYRALASFRRLSPEMKRYVKLIKTDFKEPDKTPWKDIPEDLHGIIKRLDEKDLSLD